MIILLGIAGIPAWAYDETKSLASIHMNYQILGQIAMEKYSQWLFVSMLHLFLGHPTNQLYMEQIHLSFATRLHVHDVREYFQTCIESFMTCSTTDAC